VFWWAGAGFDSSFTEQGSQQKGTIHVVRDTTETACGGREYRMLFEQAQEGVFVATLEGKLLDCNDAFVTHAWVREP